MKIQLNKNIYVDVYRLISCFDETEMWEWERTTGPFGIILERRAGEIIYMNEVH